VTLTPAGSALAPQAERVLAEVAAFEEAAREATHGRVGELRAAHSPASAEPMSHLLRMLREEQSDLWVVTHRSPSSKVAMDVAHGHISFGICQGGDWLDTPGLSTDLIEAAPINRIMIPADHRLARLPVVDVTDLGGENLVWPPASHLPTVPKVTAAAHQVRRAVSWEEAGLVDEVAAGYGVYVCTEDAARRNPRPDVVVRPLVGANVRAEHWFVQRIDEDSPALRTVRSAVRSLIKPVASLAE
jgi:DNA-binding transcriptional LysR family regulator